MALLYACLLISMYYCVQWGLLSGKSTVSFSLISPCIASRGLEDPYNKITLMEVLYQEQKELLIHLMGIYSAHYV